MVTETTPRRGNGAVAGTGQRTRQRDVRALIPELGLTEYWYPALEARRVRRKPVGLKLLGEQLVFFRGADGEVKALHNVCAHRGGSLMHGDCHFAGTVSCPYHGWTYDGEGNVLAVLPEGPESKVPGRVKTRAYRTRTLRGMVFVWMGAGEPAAIEEDVPPEFFQDDGILLYAWEVWPVNWRQAVENAGDAHVPYVHRDSMLVMLNPMTLTGPMRPPNKMVNDRAVVNVSGGGVRGRGALPYRTYFSTLDATWPKHWWRGWWAWATRWAGKRRYTSRPNDPSEEWGGMIHHLPAMVRLDYHTHSYSRVNIPIDERLTRQIYFHYTNKASNVLARLYEKVHFHTFHRWAMYSNFSVQDFRAAGPQRYDTSEYLSSTDAHLIMWRRLLLQARGMGTVADEEKEATEPERFSRERQRELGVEAEEWATTA